MFVLIFITITCLAVHIKESELNVHLMKLAISIPHMALTYVINEDDNHHTLCTSEYELSYTNSYCNRYSLSEIWCYIYCNIIGIYVTNKKK